jgi:hypothetical protein
MYTSFSNSNEDLRTRVVKTDYEIMWVRAFSFCSSQNTNKEVDRTKLPSCQCRVRNCYSATQLIKEHRWVENQRILNYNKWNSHIKSLNYKIRGWKYLLQSLLPISETGVLMTKENQWQYTEFLSVSSEGCNLEIALSCTELFAKCGTKVWVKKILFLHVPLL